MTVFITRNLTPDSDFLYLLSEAGWAVDGFSLLEFEGVPFSYPRVDWIFFYSKNGIKFFFEQEEYANEKLAVMSKASAEYLLEYDVKADFVGTGNAETTAPAFLQMAKGKRVLFPHAKNSRHSVRQLIEYEIIAIDIVVYENKKIIDFPPSDADVLVFTSPMNVEAYFEKFTLKKKQNLVAIGHTTATKLSEMGFHKFKIATEPNEIALARAVIDFG